MLALLKQTFLHLMKDLTGSLQIKALTSLQLKLQWTILLILMLLA